MKNPLIKIALIAALTISTNALATASGYYSSLQPLSTHTSAKALVPATDITIVNASQNIIYGEVPNALYDTVTPGVNDHIRHPTFTGNTYINLHANDLSRTVFWSGYVCRYSIITVYGTAAANVGIDNEYCN
jgi:hypothetical protein